MPSERSWLLQSMVGRCRDSYTGYLIVVMLDRCTLSEWDARGVDRVRSLGTT